MRVVDYLMLLTNLGADPQNWDTYILEEAKQEVLAHVQWLEYRAKAELLYTLTGTDRFPWFERCPFCDSKSMWRYAECCEDGIDLHSKLQAIKAPQSSG